jgi:hypothetical protein
MDIIQKYCPEFYLHPKENIKLMRLDLDKDKPAPIYYYLTEDSITYILVFPKDNGVALCGKQVGGHDFDIEFVRILLKEDRSYLSAHSSDQGTWIKEKAKSAYVSLGTHAIYPKPKRVWRIFGFGNDLPSDKGERIIAELQPMPMISEIQIDWSSFLQWSYSNKDLKGTSSWFFRFFYPISKYF